MAGNLQYEIRDQTGTKGGLRLELLVEGNHVASGEASADVLDAMEQLLNLNREGVEDELRRALQDLLKNQLNKVSVSEPIEDPTHPLKFRAQYTYRDHDTIETGLVWYDVSTSATGPDELPAIVRNRMRFEVHRKLTSHGGSARALVDSHG